VKSLTSLWSCAAEELAARCCTSAARDINTVVRRTEHEGLSFLAITLADYGKAIQKWLDQGFVVPSDCPAFKRAGGRCGLPAFLRGFLERVFDPCSGVLLEEPCIEAIYAVRQLSLMFSKIALPSPAFQGQIIGGRDRKVVSPERERRAMREFLECEEDVKASDARLDPLYLADFRRMSEMLFGDLFAKVDRDVHWDRLIPKHGPGATADRLSSNAKFNLRTWTARMMPYFPADSFLIPNLSFGEELGRELDVLEPGQELPVRVITVPKTLKAPRVIAIEPTAMQYAQQSIRLALLDALKEDGFLSRIIGIDDQIPNQEMARLGSLRGDLATLDLSEASDRVSNQHVLAMLEGYPQLLGAVQSCRSRKADVPGHGVIRLAKFASMGSALCFPFEAMVFATVIFLGIERELNTPLCRNDLLRYDRQVRVFGDDLIVPRDHVLSVVDELSAFGHKVNVSKSYWTGRFRESCGKEYYDGQDVSIVKVRQVLPARRSDASGVIAVVALRNQLYQAGMWGSVRWLDDFIRGVIKHFPNVSPTSPLLGRVSFLGYEYSGLDRNTHSPFTKGYRVSAKPPSDPLDGVGALLKCLLRGHPWGLTPPMGAAVNAEVDPLGHLKPSVDTEHLERTGRPERVSIKLGRGSPV
jgi:hypothetical protein